MKEVTLYTTQKKQVLSYDMQSIRQYSQVMNDVVPIRNSPDFVQRQEIEEYNLLVQKFCWQTSSGYKEVYAAFDKELLELIGCSQERFQRDVNEAVDSRVKQQYSDLLVKKTELETLQNMNVWPTLKWAFSKIWRKK